MSKGIWLILLFLPFWVLGSTTDSMVSHEVPAVTIEAQRRAVGLFDGEFVNEGDLPSGESADKLLAHCTECFIKDYGPGALSTISIRGLSASQTKVFWGEMPMVNPMLGQTDLSLLAILPGQELRFSSDNRNEGAGGELLISETEPEFDSLRIAAYQQLGSFLELRTGLNVQMPLSKWLSSYTAVQRSASKNDFSYSNPNWGVGQNRVNEHAACEIWTIQQGLSFKIRERHLLKVEYRGDIADRQLAPLMTEWSSQKVQMDDIHTVKIEGQFYTMIGSINTFTGFNHHRNRYHDTAISLYSNNLSKLLSSGVRLDGAKERFSYGFQIRHDWQQGKSTSYLGEQHGIHSNLELGYSIDLQEADLKFVGGLKHSVVNGSSAPISPTAGITLRSFGPVRWQANYTFARQYRFPTLNDLFWDPGGNPNLEPEDGWGTELNLGFETGMTRKSQSTLGVSSAVYYQRLSNYILWAPDQTGVWQASNLDQVKAYGFEGRLSQQYVFDAVQLSITAKYAYQRIGNMEGEELGPQHIYAPENQFSTSLQLAVKGFSIRSDIRYTDRRFTSRDHSSALDPFWILDASISYDLKLPGRQWLQFGLYGSNLTGSDYQVVANRPMPGPSIRGSISYHFAHKMF